MGGTPELLCPLSTLPSQPGRELRDRTSEWPWEGPCPKAIATSVDHVTLTPERVTYDGSHYHGSAGGCNLSPAAGSPPVATRTMTWGCIETLALCWPTCQCVYTSAAAQSWKARHSGAKIHILTPDRALHLPCGAVWVLRGRRDLGGGFAHR